MGDVTRTRKLLATAVVLGVMGVAVGAATYAAFGGTTFNSTNAITAGTVVIGDNDVNGAVLGLPAGSKPGDSDIGCLKVSYTGSLPATVRMYSTVTSTGTSLAPYLSVTVTRGQETTPDVANCGTFDADDADYGHGLNGIVFQGKLSDFPSSYAAGEIDPDTWTGTSSHSYKFAVSLDDNAAAQGLNASAEFLFEARPQ